MNALNYGKGQSSECVNKVVDSSNGGAKN